VIAVRSPRSSGAAHAVGARRDETKIARAPRMALLGPAK
jgi:hypothetical protein